MDAVSGVPLRRPSKLTTTPPPSSCSSTTLVPSIDTEALWTIYADMCFESVDGVFAALQNTISAGEDCLVVAPINHKQYNAVCQERDARNWKVRLFYLGTKASILVITIPTHAHETMHVRLFREISDQTAQMGLARQSSSSSAATYIGPSSSYGQADGNLMPYERVGADLWPTIVFEAGHSQSEASLYAKRNRWFQASNHLVKIVVLIKAFPRTAEKRLKIEHWQERLSEPVRPGATGTRHSSSLEGACLRPTCLQTVNITWAGLVPFDEASKAQVADESRR